MRKVPDMTQHDVSADVNVVPAYEVDTIGAPFRVTLKDSVVIRKDPDRGKEIVCIPDPIGMVHTVARSRAVHPRKLSGPDIVFLRKALGLRGKQLASYLDISPEHYSRCEAGTKVFSSATERLFRLFVFVASFYEAPEQLLAKMEAPDIAIEPVRKPNVNEANESLGNQFLKYFMTMKIQSVFSTNELHFELTRKCVHHTHVRPCSDKIEDGKWERLAA
jgi:DNA-binding transcriptional regulator YiaG